MHAEIQYSSYVKLYTFVGPEIVSKKIFIKILSLNPYPVNHKPSNTVVTGGPCSQKV